MEDVEVFPRARAVPARGEDLLGQREVCFGHSDASRLHAGSS
jgi:hypothetical protein